MNIRPVDAKKGSIGCGIERVRQAISNERNRSGTRRERGKSVNSLTLLVWPWISEKMGGSKQSVVAEMAR
jgi:hypothetical protein